MDLVAAAVPNSDSQVETMSAALRAYADREASARNDTTQHAAETAASANKFSDVDAPFVGKRVLIAGLMARPDLNGQTGEAVSFSSESARYGVQLPGGEQIALRATNLSIHRANANDAEAFSAGTRVKLKGLSAKPELNGCGATVVEWVEDKERFAVELDGSLQKMLLRAANLERDKRERWAPEMHSAANLAHIQAEQDRYVQEQSQQNPFSQMFGADGADMLMKQQAERDAQRAEEG